MLIVVSTIEYCRVKRENSFIHYPMTRGCRVVDCCVMEGIYFRHCRSSMSWDPQNHHFQCHSLGSYSRCPKLQEIVVPTYPTNSDHLTLSKLFYCNDNSSFSWNDFHPHFCDPKKCCIYTFWTWLLDADDTSFISMLLRFRNYFVHQMVYHTFWFMAVLHSVVRTDTPKKCHSQCRGPKWNSHRPKLQDIVVSVYINRLGVPRLPLLIQ